jgi:succinate dehydrogenase / fumarate reductase cytochrome b subunit
MSSDDRWLRWHRRSGTTFLGLFFVFHIISSSSALAGSEAYGRVVVSLVRSPVFPVLELLVVVPLAIHVAWGIKLLRQRATADAVVARYGDRRLWTLQRAASVVLLVFLAVHLWELRIQRLLFGLMPSSFFTVLSARLSWTWAGVPWLALLYIVGLAAAAFHFGSGLYAASSDWQAGSDARTGRVGKATVLLGVVLFVLGSATVIGLATGTRLLPSPAPAPDESVCGPKGSSR